MNSMLSSALRSAWVAPIVLAFAPPSVLVPAPTLAFPPDAERAAEALKASPRHGEWVEVPMPPAGAPAARPDSNPDGAPPSGAAAGARPETVKTWVVYPERKDAAPVVLVIHEIFGLTDWVRGVADAVAAEGFIAVAPDLLSGKGPGGGATESFQGDKAREAVGALSGHEVARRLDAVRAYAFGLPSAKPASASIGFCWGGSTSFAYATVQPELKGAIVYYGTAPKDKEGLSRITCPVLGFYGGDDARVTSTVDATATAMRELGRSFTSKTYNGAGHGFLRQQAGRDGANLAAARDAWSESIAFLKRTLDGPAEKPGQPPAKPGEADSPHGAGGAGGAGGGGAGGAGGAGRGGAGGGGAGAAGGAGEAGGDGLDARPRLLIPDS